MTQDLKLQLWVKVKVCVMQNGGTHKLEQILPIFIWKCDKMNGRLMENVMPYFLTDEPWTHATKLPKPTYYPPPQPLQPPLTTHPLEPPVRHPKGALPTIHPAVPTGPTATTNGLPP